MSLMDSTELDNIEKWLDPSDLKKQLDASSNKKQPENDKKIDDFDPNFSWVKALKETGIDLNLKPKEAMNLQDSMVALHQLLSPRKKTHSGEEGSVSHPNDEREINMHLSRIMEALGYTRDQRNKTESKDDSKIHAEVDKILKDLELSLDKVDTVSSEGDDTAEVDPKTIANVLEDELFKEENKTDSVPDKQQTDLPEVIKVEGKTEEKPVEFKAQSELKTSIKKEPEVLVSQHVIRERSDLEPALKRRIITESKVGKDPAPDIKFEENIFPDTKIVQQNANVIDQNANAIAHNANVFEQKPNVIEQNAQVVEQKPIESNETKPEPPIEDLKLAKKAVTKAFTMQKKEKKCMIF